MKSTKILYIGRHSEIMEIVVRLINANENWEGIGAITDEEAMRIFQKENIEIVLLGSGIDEESEAMLDAFFRKTNSKIIIIQHYGGGSGLLKSEILLALSNFK
ncbi:hypothetical protein [Flavobacterium sp. 123]|jgi:hypothetical protein|uniref:hypothetical protein n=1 Tax=Flavobacterium sp. 123 TaxID=2135627 RepID=UPI000EB08A3A|nr:hypothetical protein [Flavobacterium sp. 123]RKS98833.1 hypothetical protein C8C88_0584 [Flavobacterium sp. 123]